MPNPLAADLDHVLAHTEGVWEQLRGARLFVTGGTGFFGCWLLESFLWASDRMELKATMTVLTRSPERFRAKAPHLAGHGREPRGAALRARIYLQARLPGRRGRLRCRLGECARSLAEISPPARDAAQRRREQALKFVVPHGAQNS